MKVVVILNPIAGCLGENQPKQLNEEIIAIFAEYNIIADMKSTKLEDLAGFLEGLKNSKYDCVVAGGGDGTVATIAEALAGTEKILGVLPLGTLNHFAKDLKIPLSLKDAIRVIATGTPHKIDLAEVNGRLFINNSSIGMYPQVIKDRNYQVLVWGKNKWIAMFGAALEIFHRFPMMILHIDTPDQSITRATPSLFVGNNRYEISLTTLRNRTAVDRGELCVYVLKATGRWQMLKVFFRALWGRLNQTRDFDFLFPKELRIETRKPFLSVATDGEVIQMRSPLHYKIRPQILRVVLPRDDEQ